MADPAGARRPPLTRTIEAEAEAEVPFDEELASLPDPDPARLRSILQDRFGHSGFRGCQEEVIGALTGGEDVLLVMPTGAGKSLCYQLPGLVRRGCTVVISPLIALMDDQTDQLCRLGLVAASVHSGKDRPELRRICQAYLDGALDYMFVSPERLRSKRFRDFLTRRTPSLIAVDEAHCISQWGHDFRPDYRLLAETLARFASTPIVALTATATPRVQDDILERLGRPAMRRFIYGFRRDNLALELLECPRSARESKVRSLLDDAELRPAIVYVPTRRLAEELADALAGGEGGAACYHAGMDNRARERVQRAFLGGELDVIVATSAFGMGVDKADVRSVIHVGLPSSVEAYYQEIGRAGRDGKPSRAVLLYSWADRRIQESLLDRSYPAPEVLRQIHGALGSDPIEVERLRELVRCPPDVFERALDQLKANEGAVLEGWPARASRGPSKSWLKAYKEQRDRRQAEIEEMTQLVEVGGCRMCRVVAHFGDRSGSTEPCGLCDVCAPEETVARTFRAADEQELTGLKVLLGELGDRRGVPKGRLFRDVGAAAVGDRKAFERLVDGLVRAGLVKIEVQSFDKDGETISYQRLHLTEEGWEASEDDVATVRVEVEAAPKRSRRKKRRPATDAPPLDDEGEARAEHLRSWRREEAKSRGVPAYIVLSNRTLEALAGARPTDEDQLLAVHGVGPRFVERYGEQVIELMEEAT